MIVLNTPYVYEDNKSVRPYSYVWFIFSAMRNETKQRTGNKLHLEATRKSSKGSSRSSTPNEKKENGSIRSDDRNREEPRTKKKEKSKENSRQNTPTDRMFDENAYFDVMDYLPPHLVCSHLSQHFHAILSSMRCKTVLIIFSIKIMKCVPNISINKSRIFGIQKLRPFH